MKRKTLSARIVLRVDPQTARLIRNNARREGLPDSQIVRRALRHYFDNQEAKTA